MECVLLTGNLLSSYEVKLLSRVINRCTAPTVIPMNCSRNCSIPVWCKPMPMSDDSRSNVDLFYPHTCGIPSSSSLLHSPSGPFAALWPLTISDLPSIDSSRALASSWTLLSQTLRGWPGGLFRLASWPLAFCLRGYPPSDAVRQKI